MLTNHDSCVADHASTLSEAFQMNSLPPKVVTKNLQFGDLEDFNINQNRLELSGIATKNKLLKLNWWHSSPAQSPDVEKDNKLENNNTLVNGCINNTPKTKPIQSLIHEEHHRDAESEPKVHTILEPNVDEYEYLKDSHRLVDGM